jgi:hypothetical protein
MFTYSSRTLICTKLGMLIPWEQEEILERSKLRRSVLSLSPGEGGSCSSETKHDRRMAPRPKLFFWKRRLQKQRPQHRTTILGSCPCDDAFVYWKLNTIEWHVDKNCFFLQEQRSQTQKSALVSSPDEDVGFRDFFPLIFSDTYQMTRPIRLIRNVGTC